MDDHTQLKKQLADAEETMNLMRAECELAPGMQHDPIECTHSWRKINNLWSQYQRKYKLAD